DTVVCAPENHPVPPMVALCRTLAGTCGNSGGGHFYVRPDPRANLAGAAALGRAHLRGGRLPCHPDAPLAPAPGRLNSERDRPMSETDAAMALGRALNPGTSANDAPDAKLNSRPCRWSKPYG